MVARDWSLDFSGLDNGVLFVEQFPDLVVFITDATLYGHSAGIVTPRIKSKQWVNNDIQILFLAMKFFFVNCTKVHHVLQLLKWVN